MICRASRAATLLAALSTLGLSAAPLAGADNSRLNNSVVSNVYTVRYQRGCLPDITVDPALTQAAQRHARDIIAHRELAGDLGSDGSTPQTRSAANGFSGIARQTVAITPSLAINNLDVITQWFRDPVAHAIMSDCANAAIGVWSENSLDRSVVVAVYGRPA
jgi:uncharacterized protein YkwD